MSRIFMDDWRTARTLLLQTGGATTALELLASDIDLSESCTDDESALIMTTDQPLVTTSSFAKLTGYDSAVGGDAEFLITDFLAGDVTTSAVAGFSYQFNAQISFICTNNAVYQFSLMRNGVATGFVASITGTGNGDLQTVNLEGLELSALANSIWSVGFLSLGGGDALTILQAFLRATIKPTNNPS
jgi:hypothetical protein